MKTSMPSPEKIVDLFRIDRRFLRSINLEKDFLDRDALKNYVLTPFIRSCLQQMVDGLKVDSGRKAWRLVGDYGSGKSSFALLLAHLFQGNCHICPDGLDGLFAGFGDARPKLLPVLITGTRQPLGTAILQSLYQAWDEDETRSEIKRVLSQSDRPDDAKVLEQIERVKARVVETGCGTGLLLVIDEMGKFLEFSAIHPSQQDVYLFQQLAELAVRNRKNVLYLVGLLHQGFGAYFEQLGMSTKREWEKVAGRFDDILFNQPLTQLVGLVKAALNINEPCLHPRLIQACQWRMQQALKLNLYGSDAVAHLLEEEAYGVYPLDPLTLPVLMRTLQRFGQNERSLFSFLTSHEVMGLQSFAQAHLSDASFFRLPELFDYIRANLSHRLTSLTRRHHWYLILEMVEGHSSSNHLETEILKAVGVLNLIDANDLLASDEIIECVLGGPDEDARHQVRKALLHLCEKRRVLHKHGYAEGYRLWPHTSVNLDNAYEEAKEAIGDRGHVAEIVKGFLDPRPIVANRHYIETGNLRYFDVLYVAVEGFAKALSEKPGAADGVIVVPLCETEEERGQVMDTLASAKASQREDLLVAVPPPLANVKGFALEAARWAWLETNYLDLNTDRFAREEVTRHKILASRSLKEHLEELTNLKRFTKKVGLTWIYKMKAIDISSGKQLLAFLSDVFDRIFCLSPLIANELINRRKISSSAAKARFDLISALVSKPHLKYLGLGDGEKRPPEMAMYLSILGNGNLHVETDYGWRVVIPENDTCRMEPSFSFIEAEVKQSRDQKMNVKTLFQKLKQPPFGLMDGVIPLVLAIFATAKKHELAFFDQGSFLTEMSAEAFLTLIKEPKHFDIQLCQIEGVHGEVFDRLLNALGKQVPGWRPPQLLDVVRPLCEFLAGLPEYTQKTKTFSKETSKIRVAILTAREPATLLFKDLPSACGLNTFWDSKSFDEEKINHVVHTLKEALKELRDAYPRLLEKIKTTLQICFEIPGCPSNVRTVLKERSRHILVHIREPELKALCLRLVDEKLSDALWLESIGSLIQRRPPRKWLDRDVQGFKEKIALLAEHFTRVEATHFETKNAEGLRLALTRADGVERNKVVFMSEDEQESVAHLEEEIHQFIKKNKRLGMIAASRVLWKFLEND